MKVLLILCLLACTFSLIKNGWSRSYPVTLAYLLGCVAATATPTTAKFYVSAGVTVCVLRLLAAVEVAYRQAERFQGRFWLLFTALWAGIIFAAGCWYVTDGGSAILQFVEVRRTVQVFEAAALLFVECFWLSQGGGAYRDRDWIGLVFLGILLNHAIVSLASLGNAWTFHRWMIAAHSSWTLDAICYVLLAILFSPYPIVRKSILAWTRFRHVRESGPNYPASALLSRR